MLVGVIVFVASPLMSGVKQQTAKAESRATNWLLNGSFENVTGGVPDNWTMVETHIDLGVTALGGCVSVDTTDYAAIRAGSVPADLTTAQDNHSSFTNSIVTSGGFGAPADGTNAIFMNMGGGTMDPPYHVSHGPAIVSDAFKGLAGQVITLNWFSAAGADDYAVLGYLLDTDANGDGVVSGTAADCSQTEILDTTGKTVVGWQYASVTVPDSHNFYRFVFVNGTHDESGGRYSGASFWIDNISQGDPQTITMDLSDVTGKNYFAGAISAPFSIATEATATSGLAATYQSTTPSVCTVSGVTVTLTGSGTCTIRASQSGGVDGTGKLWASAQAVTSSFTVTNTAPTAQTITFGPLTDKESTAPNFTVSATSSSSMPVTFSSTTPSVCTVTSSGTVDVLTAGTCTVKASQAGGLSGGVFYGAAPDVNQSFTVQQVTAQTIAFPAITDRPYNGADIAINPTVASGLVVTVTSMTPSVCTISGGKVKMLKIGTCTIKASQPGAVVGTTRYTAAPDVIRSFEATAVPQTLTVPVLANIKSYDPAFSIAGSASSGMPVTYTSLTPEICTVSGATVTAVGGQGKCTIVASQAGGVSGGITYAEATSIQREFFVLDQTPTPTMTATNTRTPTPTQTPTPIPFLLKKGAIGASFVLGLLQNDTLVTWGMNREFQANIPPCCGSNIQDIAVGTNFALALKGGRVYGWGANTKGQLKFPKTVLSGIKAVAAGGAHGLALTNAGKVIAWGDNKFTQTNVPKLTKVVKSVVGGNDHTVVLFTDGTVKAWGANASKQSSPPTTLKDITQIAAGLDHNLALTNKGTVVAWGGNTFGQAKIPTNAIDIKQVSAGTQFSMAVKNNGEVIAWGRNDYNQTIIPPEYTDIYSAFAGYANTILGLRSGRVIVLGDQNNGVAVSRTPTKTATPTP
jgi:alpha-tubulin suppressor-like RCC1 family protein